jgi:AGZA family xanthine/uracil permease-like MFS transporter
MRIISKLFDTELSGAVLRREALAGATTFLTMAYIIFVQPAVLSGAMFGFSTGMDAGAVMAATCWSASRPTSPPPTPSSSRSA